MSRSLKKHLLKDLNQKFVLLAGPRQVGKTHLAEEILGELGGKYYNWDLAEDRERVLNKSMVQDKVVVLDELHKYERWKGFLKGVYDKYHKNLRVLVTGSARLDVYRRGGDSLLGRHYLYHLHPFSVGERLGSEIPRPEIFLRGDGKSSREATEIFDLLMRFGGFPEPFFKSSEEEHGRWSTQRRELLVRQDIRDLTHIQHLGLVEHLLLLLPHRVGSVLSVNSLREDLQVAYNTVCQWLESLEKLYIHFSLSPYSERVGRGLKKGRKIYLWDWSQVPDEGARFESLVASHLFKAVQYWKDLGYGDFELFFLRDRDRRETDFLVTLNRKPWALVETKLSEEQPAEALLYFENKFRVPAFQILSKKGIDRMIGPVRVVSAEKILPLLP